MNKKKILFIVSNLKVGGGAENSVAILTKGLAKYYDVEILTFYNFKNEYEYFVKRHNFNYNYANNIIIKSFRILVYFPLKLRQFLKNNKYDLVVSNAEDANMVALICKKMLKFKLWTVIRNNIFSKGNAYYRFKNLHNTADKTIVLTKAMQKRVKFDTVAIGNAIELDEINKKKKEAITGKEKKLFEKKTIVMVGRLASQKNYAWFFDMFKDIEEDVNLLVIGNGPLEQELKEKTKNQKNIHFLGTKNNVYKYLNKADVFVLPSLFEGMPRALMEALASGCVCVANDCQTGPRELLGVELNKELKTYNKTKYGYIVPFNNKDEFKKACDDALKKGKKIKSDTRFELNNIIEKWIREIKKGETN